VFPHWFRIEWRELAMPIDDLSLTVGHSLHYGRVTPRESSTWNQFSRIRGSRAALYGPHGLATPRWTWLVRSTWLSSF
jgi:hypothetical protein